MTALEALKGAREILAEESRWIKGRMRGYRYPDGSVGMPGQRQPNCFCLAGAIHEAGGIGSIVSMAAVSSLSQVIYPTIQPLSYTEVEDNVIGFNDQPEREHAQVLAILDRTIAKWEAEA
jgi:hypothetical protein